MDKSRGLDKVDTVFFLLKGLVTPRDHGFFSSKTHVIEEILNFFVCQYLLFWVILKNQQSDIHIFTFSKCKDDLTSLFTSQPITVVALSTALVCRLRAPSAGAPTVCPLAPHPAAPQQLPLACQAASSREQARLASCPALPYTFITR